MRSFVIAAAALFAGVNALPLLKGLESQLASKFPMESAAGLRGILDASLALAAKSEGVDATYVTCTRDYAGCPEGFLDSGAGLCTPPTFYEGSCGDLDMSGLTPPEKHGLAAGCGASFPCMESCAKNYSGSCPSGWSSSNGQCVAPPSYAGPCASPTKFDHLSHHQKVEFEGICGVEFCA